MRLPSTPTLAQSRCCAILNFEPSATGPACPQTPSRIASATMPDGFQPDNFQLQRVSVSFEYPVIFCDDLLAPNAQHLSWAVSRLEPDRSHPILVFLDAGVEAEWPAVRERVAQYCNAHARHLALRAPVVLVPGGEAAKNDELGIRGLIEALARAKMDRHSAVVAIGGGAVLDAVGYAASLVHRGLRLVRCPTTVLAQNDAGIGVKNGVNAFGAKNFLGTFAPPWAVVNASCWLETLPTRDISAGLAEAVKVACIRDAGFFEWLERNARALNRPGPELQTAIQRCAELHLRHIATSGDPFELGSARPLDYGHWAAHRLEVMSGHALRHGEAVAIGMLLDARYAVARGMLAPNAFGRLHRLLLALKLPVYHPSLRAVTDGEMTLLRGLEDFREHLGGELTITLLQDIGRATEVHEMDHDELRRAIDWLDEQPKT